MVHMVVCFLRIVWDFLKEFFFGKCSFVETLNETIYLFSWSHENLEGVVFFLFVNQSCLQFFCVGMLRKKEQEFTTFLLGDVGNYG